MFGETSSLEFLIKRSDTDVVVLANAAPIRDRDGSSTGAITVLLDITKQRVAEHERSSITEQFIQSQKMEAIGRLAGGIAHDFNNLLTVINSYSIFAIEDLREGDPMRDDIQMILRAGQRATTLTRQLLAFSRKTPMDIKVLDLNEVIGDLDKMLTRLIGEDVDIRLVLAKELGRIKADVAQVEQVLVNLAVNARDAMPEGGTLTIETANIRLDEHFVSEHPGTQVGHHVILTVTDTGIGMEAKTKEQIFEPFFTTKEATKGTGLGLAMVYGIIKQSGGSIWVESEPGQGTSFKMYMPSVQAKKTERTRKIIALNLRGTETILVVEDEDDVRTLTKRILTSADYTVITAANGGEALLECERRCDDIHLLLTDVVMPKMSGKVLADRLISSSPKLKVLYMSGYTNSAIEQHGVLAPGTHFLVKPFSAHALLAKVRMVLDGG